MLSTKVSTKNFRKRPLLLHKQWKLHRLVVQVNAINSTPRDDATIQQKNLTGNRSCCSWSEGLNGLQSCSDSHYQTAETNELHSVFINMLFNCAVTDGEPGLNARPLERPDHSEQLSIVDLTEQRDQGGSLVSHMSRWSLRCFSYWSLRPPLCSATSSIRFKIDFLLYRLKLLSLHFFDNLQSACREKINHNICACLYICVYMHL